MKASSRRDGGFELSGFFVIVATAYCLLMMLHCIILTKQRSQCSKRRCSIQKPHNPKLYFWWASDLDLPPTPDSDVGHAICEFEGGAASSGHEIVPFSDALVPVAEPQVSSKKIDGRQNNKRKARPWEEVEPREPVSQCK